MAFGEIVGTSLEVPRVTSTLRVLVRDGGRPFDVDQQLLQRKQALARRSSAGATSAEAGHAAPAVGATSLAQRLVPEWEKAPGSVREAYESFLVAVQSLLATEVSSADLHEAAGAAFDCIDRQLSARRAEKEKQERQGEEGGRSDGLARALSEAHSLSDADLGSIRSALSDLLGLISSDLPLIRRTVSLTLQLLAWQRTHRPQPHHHHQHRSAPHQEPSDSFMFGADVPFQVPGAGLDGNQLLQQFWEEARARTQAQAQSCVEAAQWGGGAQLTADELSLAVLKLMQSLGSGDEVAGELFNLVGDQGFEFIQQLLQHRKALVSAAQSALSALKEAVEADAASSGASNSHVRHGATVTVQTESEKQLEKLRKKEDKKIARAAAKTGGGGGVGGVGGRGGVEGELAWLLGAGGFSALVEAGENKVGGVIDALIGTGDDAVSVRALPVGTKRKAFKGYEEVHVPPAAVEGPGRAQEKLVRVGEMEPFAQKAFEGFQTLNRIQSRIYQRAFYSNENLLVCAPTGAGKTNIAMITILHEVGANFKNGVLQKNDFKIVYVAPMKALAAEMAAAFGRRLAPLGLAVRELTGDMQLTKREMEETQMIVTTPEKWDVITRKSSDVSMASLVRLLVIDEVHLLNDDRGPVIETLVARTLRQVESSQSMIRIVGLSATLPNYTEVAQFLRVNLDTGLFYFDASYRPVPLSQQYIGVSEPNFARRNTLMHEIAYEKAMNAVKNGKQAMVFVHSRKDTVKTARILMETAQRNGEVELFNSQEQPQYKLMEKDVMRSRNREMAELFQAGFGIHHAGMLRPDRSLTEKLFSMGLIKVLVCTATLAWGVNLPAHTVIIKGTQLYDAKVGGFRELVRCCVVQQKEGCSAMHGVLSSAAVASVSNLGFEWAQLSRTEVPTWVFSFVLSQIFGRAGRPQFDSSGEGIIITAHNQLAHYLRLMTHQLPIESQFVAMLKDNLNAEVVLGTVTNVKEASAWLGYTYLFMRMQANPLAYGMTWQDVAMDPGLVARRQALITEAARALDRAKMMRFDERSGQLYVTELGRVASHFYIRYTSVETYNELLRRHMSESEIVDLIARSSEFENIVVREEEMPELFTLRSKFCPLDVKGGPEDKIGKINILIQVYLSRGYLDSFSLIADTAYVSASLGRITRALFEIALKRGWCSLAASLLEMAKAVDQRIWPHQHPLRQFESVISQEVLFKLEDRGLDLDRLCDMDDNEIAAIIRSPYAAKLVSQCVSQFPYLELDVHISPITRTVLQVTLYVTPTFQWKDRFHGNAQRWWIWVEDSENEHIYHTEYFILSKKMMAQGTHTLAFTIPIFEPLPPQYYVRAISDNWLSSSSTHTISFRHLILPERHPPHTELLNLRPLPVTALGDPEAIGLYGFSHFNPIQTQAFHTLYHTDHSVLLGAPTGSGKTISAELAMLRLFRTQPGMKVIYIAPLKALVRERMEDWGKNFMPKLGKCMVELTGDLTPDMKLLVAADVIVATPEKWDGITRSWHNRSYAQTVGLMVMDEIHLLGQDRGPVLEVIVSRMRYISARTSRPIRFLGLSTALANARDLADWLGIERVGLFNFKPSVRPVPLDVHIQGYPGKFYCPRMNAMNKPLYAAILTHSPVKPVLVFVSSRRQTRLTALDLIQYAAADERPRQFVHASEEEMEAHVAMASSAELKHTLQFGIGLHHAGLTQSDRSLVETLFAERKIQVLVCTSTLAWGVNLPAHLVVVKGTEYFDGKQKRYVEMPITDVLQMMGRAGRPQFDNEAKAVILVHEPKKSFYKKFLYEPFPVESSLHLVLHDHLNAEVAGGSIASVQDAMDYLTWTFFFRRLLCNPSFYGLADTSAESVNIFLSDLVSRTLSDLDAAGCIALHEDGSVDPLPPGLIASQYYLHFTTAALFTANLTSPAAAAAVTLETVLHVLCGAAEFDELPVRHNEEFVNAELAKHVRWKVDHRTYDDPHTKTNLLLQAHFSRLAMPMSDYETDLKSVLDQTIRVLQAMIDTAATAGQLQPALLTMRLTQMVIQAVWCDLGSPLAMLPHVTPSLEDALSAARLASLSALLSASPHHLRQLLASHLSPAARADFLQALGMLPRLSMAVRVLPSGTADGEKKSVSPSAPAAAAAATGVVVEVSLRRSRPHQPHSLRAYTPFFPKVKEEGWWVVVAAADSPTLLALKRVSFTHRLTTRLHVPELLSSVKQLSVHLISDCYVGLDQQVTVSTNAAAAVTAQGTIGKHVIENVGFVTAAAAAAGEEKKGNGLGGGEGCLDSRPVITKSIPQRSYSALLTSHRRHKLSHSILDPPATSPLDDNPDQPPRQQFHWDAFRTARMAGAGLLLSGPTLHLWFTRIARFIPGTDVPRVLLKITLGQLLYSPIFNSVFFSINAALQGENREQIVARLRRDLIPTLISGACYWPVCDFITFRYVPVRLQVLTSNTAAFFWTIYVTYKASLAPAAAANADADGDATQPGDSKED
ncbi:unnamed protein product [Closterium sp. Yama58-4]|nr:unnamed protein product [Closterium sp. Yama58-4]